nr:BLTX158 [Nephila pilipes]
MLENCV